MHAWRVIIRSAVEMRRSRIGASLPPCSQTGQALLDDLPCLVHQLANDLSGRLDLADQANALARQQVHRLDIPAGVTVRRESHEPQHRHGLPADDGPADRRLVRARLQALGLLTEPLFHEGRSQCPVWGVGPAVAEQGRANRVPLAGLQHLLLVARVGARLGAGQKAGAHSTAACAPKARTATTPRASPMPPAAATGRGATASTTRGTRARVETSPATWPPASTPWAMMTSTPAAAARRASATEPT